MKKLASFFLSAAIACSAGPSKISADLMKTAATNGSQPVQVIVQWKTGVRGGILQKLLALGGSIVSDFPLVHSGVYTVAPSALSTLSADPDVAFVSADRAIHKNALFSKEVTEERL
ncbi:MAG: hypothetical protein ACJ746_14750 [Bryobacteraceae bacterium]